MKTTALIALVALLPILIMLAMVGVQIVRSGRSARSRIHGLPLGRRLIRFTEIVMAVVAAPFRAATYRASCNAARKLCVLAQEVPFGRTCVRFLMMPFRLISWLLRIMIRVVRSTWGKSGCRFFMVRRYIFAPCLAQTS